MSEDDQEGGEGVDGPDFDVWNHLESGWQMAHDDMALKLPPEMLALFKNLAKVIVGAQSTPLVSTTDPAVAKQLSSMFPTSEVDQSVILARLLGWFATRKDPWLTHAVELELGSQGIGRATIALKRFQLLAPRLGRQPIPDRALPYVREAMSSFLFGFDAATVALCRATLEQVAKEVALRIGVYTEGELRRLKYSPTLETFLEKLKQANALDRSYESARRVKRQGDDVMHKHMFDEKVRQQAALDSIVCLADVLSELLP